jgi:hypothetical protein
MRAGLLLAFCKRNVSDTPGEEFAAGDAAGGIARLEVCTKRFEFTIDGKLQHE